MNRKVHLICNAHLDPVWLWEWPEGAAEALATFRTAADLGDEHPEFVFNHNEAVLYRWVKDYDPALFAGIRGLVARRRWHVMGGWHLQPDANLPCGESFVRQVLLGRRFFREAFGVEPTTAVNLDSFGHSRGLVQVLARSGFDSYLFCRPGAAELDLPGETFVWVGYDGSEVMAQRATAHYNSRRGEARSKLESWLASNPEAEVSVLLWGVGNHGGGASRRDLEDLARFRTENPEVEAVHSTPEDYFRDVAPRRDALPRVARGLNPWAVGCYTSMARVKARHRRLESELWSAEKMSAAAFAQGLAPYPGDELREVQTDLAFAEFHDILPGSSVPAGEEGALRLLDHGLEIASRVKARAFFALAAGERAAAGGEIPLLAYNQHPFPVSGLVEAEFQPAEPNPGEREWRPRVFREGVELPSQGEKEQSTLSIEWRKRVVFRAELPAGAMARFDCRVEPAKDESGRAAVPSADTPWAVDAPWGRAAIDPATGLLDEYRVAGKECLAKGAWAHLVMEDDADSWGMAVRSFRKEAGGFRLMTVDEAAAFSALAPEEAKPVRVVEDGAVRRVFEALFIHGASFICQRYKVSKLDPEFEVETRVIWNEKDRMLKLSLPTPWPGAVCLGQQAFGAEEIRPGGDEGVAQKWSAVVSRDSGLALTVVNDRTYGLDFAAGELRLSLLRSPAYAADVPAGKALRVRDRFLPRQDQGEHVFRFWIRGGGLEERLRAIDREALVRNEPAYVLPFFPGGTGRKPGAAAVLGDEAVVLTAFKKAEDNDDLIIRLFEPTGTARETTLTLPWAPAETRVRLRGFEVRTLRFEPGTRRFREVDLLERDVTGGRAKGKVRD